METFRWRIFGDYGHEYWIMVICNTLIPLLFLFKKIRTSISWLFGISLLINVGMWYERFVIIIGSVAHDFLPYAWGLYWPRPIELGIMLGSFCLFFFLFVLFVKHLPSVSMTEMKETLHQSEIEKDQKTGGRYRLLFHPSRRALATGSFRIRQCRYPFWAFLKVIKMRHPPFAA